MQKSGQSEVTTQSWAIKERGLADTHAHAAARATGCKWLLLVATPSALLLHPDPNLVSTGRSLAPACTDQRSSGKKLRGRVGSRSLTAGAERSRITRNQPSRESARYKQVRRVTHAHNLKGKPWAFGFFQTLGAPEKTRGWTRRGIRPPPSTSAQLIVPRWFKHAASKNRILDGALPPHTSLGPRPSLCPYPSHKVTPHAFLLFPGGAELGGATCLADAHHHDGGGGERADAQVDGGVGQHLRGAAHEGEQRGGCRLHHRAARRPAQRRQRQALRQHVPAVLPAAPPLLHAQLRCVRGVGGNQVGGHHAQEGEHLEHKLNPASPGPKTKNLRVRSRRVARSEYK